MDAIKLMMEEHEYIKRALVVVRKMCFDLLKGGEVNYNDFASIIDFIRKFADEHHHGKEEKMLFNRMVDEIGDTAERVIKYGMLVEHDLGRFYIMSLEAALKELKEGKEEAKLDIIANAVSYANLLDRHITKEDNVIYNYAKRELSSKTIETINNECSDFESANDTVKDKCVSILEKLEKEY